MANPSPSLRNRFRPGNRANPRGASAHNPILKAIRSLTNEELLENLNLIVKGNAAQLKAIANDPHAPVVKAMIAAVADRIITKGDMHALDMLLNRLVGKVKDEVHHQGDTFLPPQIILTLPDNGRTAKPEDDYGF